MRPILAKPQTGFTLLEILIAIAIVSLLAAIAVPAYQGAVDKARYSEMVQAAVPFQKAVAICYNRTGSLTNCRGGINGIPPNISNSSTSLVRYVFTLNNGNIYVFPNDRFGFSLLSDYYILTPTETSNAITWQFSGPAVTKGYITQ